MQTTLFIQKIFLPVKQKPFDFFIFFNYSCDYLNLLMKKILVSLFILLLSFGIFNNISSYAADPVTPPQPQAKITTSACKGEDYKVTLAKIITLDMFPIIPNCSSDNNGNAEPLKLSLLPVILFRGYAALIGLGFYLTSFMVIIYGYQWMLGGLGGYGGVEQAKKNFKRILLALIIMVSITTAVTQILNVLGYNTASGIDNALKGSYIEIHKYI